MRRRALSFLMRIVLLVAALALLFPAAAPAASNMAVSIMDDQLLLDEPDMPSRDRHMARFRSVGVGRLRVAAFWAQSAPGPGRRRKPRFDAASATDPKYHFANLDRVVDSAAVHGFDVMISITTPAP